jgi:hypothetical protein
MGERAPLPSADIFSPAKIIEVEQNLMFCAPRAALVKYFEVNRLYQRIRLSILCKMKHFENFPSDRIQRSRSFPATRALVEQQSSETDAQLYENIEVLLQRGAVRHSPSREKQGNS